MKYLALIQILLASMLVTSCVNYSSERIPPTRTQYNEALQFGDKHQLLLNIVRLRYNDLPYFFSVNNIISQINYSNTFTGGTNNTWTPPPVNFSTSGSDSVTVGEAPTITYTPLQGDAFIKKMLTPVDLRILYMLLHNSDADIGKVMRVFALQLGPFENISNHRGSRHAVIDLRFRKMVDLLTKLIDKRQLFLTSDAVNGKFAVKMELKNFAKQTPKAQKILRKLGFSKNNANVWIMQAGGGNIPSPTAPAGKTPMPSGTLQTAIDNVTSESIEPKEVTPPASYTSFGEGSKLVPIPKFSHPERPVSLAKPKKKILILQTRTLFMVLNYLAKGVHVPAYEINKNISTGSRLPNGLLLNWQFYTSGIFEVHVCKSKPKKNVFLSVEYRDRWYYIRDDDSVAKATFYVVTLLMNLYEGNVQSGLTPFYSIIT